MKVNNSKTRSVLISEIKGYLPRAFIEDSTGGQVRTSKTMKILGFEFSEEPGMAAQVSAIRRKFFLPENGY